MHEPLRALEELGDEFERLARRPRRGFRLPFRTSLLALSAVTTVSAGALAASGILTGDPVRNPPEIKPAADAGTGLTEPVSARLTALRVADPGGGPPWGLRGAVHAALSRARPEGSPAPPKTSPRHLRAPVAHQGRSASSVPQRPRTPINTRSSLRLLARL